MEYFKNINNIKYAGVNSENPLSFRYYDPHKEVLGKTMQEHLRLAVCFWHTFCWQGEDAFGRAIFSRTWVGKQDPMERAKDRVLAGFEFINKLGVPFFTFHDRDVSPEGDTLKESLSRLHQMAAVIAREMENGKKRLLWGTANLFTHPRYAAGAATNPNPEVFAYAVAQVKAALDVTHKLKGENYVLWGGREGYDTLFNTDLHRELDQYGRFLSMLVDYKHKIGFKGAFLIEPKPCEPTKHQYDFDSANVFAFLQKYGLQNEFKMNIEANHATLAGHSFAHEVAYAFANNIFGSVDANRGDPQLGWDTDQFPLDLQELTYVMYLILKNGGFKTGGFNFDAKVRRQSIDLEDLFYAHICGIDVLARALLSAANMIENDNLQKFMTDRYQGWGDNLGRDILNNEHTFESLSQYILDNSIEPMPVSGRQELLEFELIRRVLY